MAGPAQTTVPRPTNRPTTPARPGTAATPQWNQPAPNQWNQAPAQPGRGKTDGMAVAALVCGIVLGPLGLVFGLVSLSRIKKDPSLSGKGMAIAGIVLGAISLVWVIFVVIGAVVAVGAAAGAAR